MFGFLTGAHTERGDLEHTEKQGAWENTPYKSSLDNIPNNNSQLPQNKLFTGKDFLWRRENTTEIDVHRDLQYFSLEGNFDHIKAHL